MYVLDCADNSVKCKLFISDISIVDTVSFLSVSDQAEDDAHQLHLFHSTVGRETQELCKRAPVYVTAICESLQHRILPFTCNTRAQRQ